MNSTTENIESITISRAEYDSMKQEIEQLAGINNWLREQLENLKKNQFGSKRETASDEVIGQMMLFDEPEVYAYLEEFRNRYFCWISFRPMRKWRLKSTLSAKRNGSARSAVRK